MNAEDRKPADPAGSDVVDPGGDLKKIEDPQLRSQVARQRGRRGNETQARRRAEAAASAEALRSGSVEPSARHDPRKPATSAEPAPSAGSAALARLQHEAEHAKLPADRIRAAEAMLRAERAESAGSSTDEASVWLAMRATLDTLPAHERMGWLLGELQEPAESAEGAGVA